jgi:hypothetical protein
MYAGVLAVGFLGALIVRFRPRGMAHVLGVTALAQALAGLIALMAGLGSGGANWPGKAAREQVVAGPAVSSGPR